MTASRTILLFTLGLAACSANRDQSHAQGSTLPCTTDNDCPGEAVGAWSVCTGSNSNNDPAGLQARTLLAFACEQGLCQPRPNIEMRTCTRSIERPCKDLDIPTPGEAATSAPAADISTAPSSIAPTPPLPRRVSLASRALASASTSPRPASCPGAGTVCTTGNACERGEIRCDDGEPRCVATSVAPAGTVCRPASGPCDLEEHCDGVSGMCPTDAFAGAASVCRPAAGPCDDDETCTGAGPACPADVYLAHGTECRPNDGACDVREVCTGNSAMCPADDAGCGDGYCLINTCHAQPSIHVQGNVQGDDGGTCSDLARGNDRPLLRITFRGRPRAPFRYWQRHLSCAGSAFEEHAAVPCDEGTVGQLDATGTCTYTYTVRDRAAGAVCPDPRVGRWELSVEIDGQRSPSAFVDLHHSALTCPGNPRTCTAAATYCPPTGDVSALASQPTAFPEEWQ